MAEDSKNNTAALQRSIFHWIGYDDPFKEKAAATEGMPLHKLISADEVVKKHGIPRKELQKYIESEMLETENFASLPFTIFFVIAYACMVILHDDAVVIRAVEDSITFDVFDNANFAFDSLFMGHKDIHDVNSYADFWSWCIQGFLPLMFVQETSWSEGRDLTDPEIIRETEFFSESERGVLLHYNRIIGGVRFRQEVSGYIECDAPDDMRAFYQLPCVKTKYELDPESWPARHTENPQRERWFYVRENYTDIETKAMLMELQEPFWLDRQTLKIEISVPVYNAEFGLHTLVFFNFYFSRGGHIWKQMIPLSTYANWFTKWYFAIVDSIFYLCLLHIFTSELKEFAWIVRNKGWGALWSQYCTFWHVVDWVSVLGGFVIVLLSLLSFNGTSRVNSEALNLVAIDWSTPEGSLQYNDQVSVYVDALEDVVKYVHNLKLVFASYPLLIVFRLFKAFAAQPRLALVTNTLMVTGVDLLHFMLVFTSIFVTLAISGLVLFGRRLENFTTFPRAVNTVFRLMLGDFDWEALRQVSMVEGACWLVITITIMNLLLLNMVLAIVMDGYSEVKRSSANSDTLLMELGQIWTRWWGARRGNLVPLRAINEALLALDREFTMRSAGAYRHYGRSTADLSGAPVLLGKDTKPAIGQRVLPVDPDIATFVGDGQIIQVATTLLLCRVEHHDGTVREYNIGHDFNYELQLAEGEPVIEIDEEEEQAQSLQLLSPERLMKVVNGYGTMSHAQAISLLTDAVMHYYKDHCEDVDMDSVRQMIRKVKVRTRKVKGLILEGAGQTLSLNAAREMTLLRRFLVDFYKAIDEDRRRSHEAIHIAKKDVEELRERLVRVNPSELENMARLTAHHGGNLLLPPESQPEEDKRSEEDPEEEPEAENDVPALKTARDIDEEDLDDAQLMAEIDELLGESATYLGGRKPHNHNGTMSRSETRQSSRHTGRRESSIPDLSSEGTFDDRGSEDPESLGFSDVGSIPDIDIGTKKKHRGSSSHRRSSRSSDRERRYGSDRRHSSDRRQTSRRDVITNGQGESSFTI
mmetsp:Transcript_45191/g.104739  ORF Transcript_45191/g.104739 Transcript_45191/m.104739 type:complete len:1039 (-) Transcript_45191:51-3167(-)